MRRYIRDLSIAILATFATGVPLTLFGVLVAHLPMWANVVVIAVSVVGGTLYSIRYANRATRKAYQPNVQHPDLSKYGWIEVDQIEYEGAVWLAAGRIQRSKTELSSECNPYTVRAIVPPLCPECFTGLVEHETLLGYMVWFCAGCGWRKKKVRDFAGFSEEASMIAQQRAAERRLEDACEKLRERQ